MEDEEMDEYVVFREEIDGECEFSLSQGRVNVEVVLQEFLASSVSVKIGDRWRVLEARKEDGLSKTKFEAGSSHIVRAKRPLPPAPLSTAVTKDSVRTVLKRFEERLLKPKGGYPTGRELLVNHAVCKVPLPQAPGDTHPRLLWHALDQPHDASSFIINEMKNAQPTLTVLFNVSGSGKTRTLYEIAVAQRGLLFSGIPGSGIAAEGSGDLLAVSHKLLKLFPTGLIPPSQAAACLKAMLISRFHLLRHMENLGYRSGSAWVFKQVAFRLLKDIYRDSDPWKALTDKLLALIRSPEDLLPASSVFQEILDELKGDWNGPVIFDECQLIDGWLSGRILSSSGQSRSFLDLLVPCLLDSKFSRFFYAGTGGSMLRVVREISASRVSVMVFHGMGGFYSGDDLKAFLEPLFKNLDAMDFPRLGKLYKGRYRYFATAIEHFISSGKTMEQATAFLVDFFYEFCTTASVGRTIGRTSSPLYMDRTVLEDVR